MDDSQAFVDDNPSGDAGGGRTESEGLEQAFDREEFVSELTSYYEFLVKMYLTESKLKRPPEGGWPSLTPDKLEFMGKNEDVMYIMQHIPYIEGGKVQDTIAIYPSCIPVDYTGSSFTFDLKQVEQGEEPGGSVWESIPMLPNMVFSSEVLWIGMWEDRDGDFMILDTCRGTITIMNPMSGVGSAENSDVRIPAVKIHQDFTKLFATLGRRGQ